MKNSYIIITPAYNEQENLPRLATTVIQQTLPPKLWIIVNDDSSDNTLKIATRLESAHPFIRVVSNKKDLNIHNYALKVHAFNKGYDYLQRLGIEYEYIANLDADISLPHNYYQNLIKEFINNSRLGVAGGSYCYTTPSTKVIWSGNYVPGSILMARRKCFEESGGYKPLKFGAEDTLLCVESESNGWEVQYFPQYEVVQHRIVGTTNGFGLIKARFRQGQGDYSIGYHPLFVILKSIKRTCIEKPILFGGIARLFGFFSGPFFNCRSDTPKKAIAYLRNKQINRILKPLKR